jgi:hypothetical protein
MKTLQFQAGTQCEVTESGQVIDFIQGNSAPKQVYNNTLDNGLRAQAVRREVLNSHFLDFVCEK